MFMGLTFDMGDVLSRFKRRVHRYLHIACKSFKAISVSRASRICAVGDKRILMFCEQIVQIGRFYASAGRSSAVIRSAMSAGNGASNRIFSPEIG